MSNVPLPTFENATGQGIVAFAPTGTSAPQYSEDPKGWFHHLLVGGERVFEYGCPCGTCGILFRKLRAIEDRLTDPEAVRLLGTLETVPPPDTLRRLARVLEPGRYHAVVVEGRVRRIDPGSTDDYFATDVVRMSGPQGIPPDPRTPYYRFGSDLALDRKGAVGSHRALVTAIVMPLHDPALLDRERVEYWRREQEASAPLTAFAIAVIDGQWTMTDCHDETYPYEEQFLFTNCLLDGHHRVQAAAESGAPIRILTLLGENSSLARRNEGDLQAVLSSYMRRSG